LRPVFTAVGIEVKGLERRLGVGTVYPSGAAEFTPLPRFLVGFVLLDL